MKGIISRLVVAGLMLAGLALVSGPTPVEAGYNSPTGDAKVIIVRANFYDTEETGTVAAAEDFYYDDADSVEAYFTEVSYGQLTFDKANSDVSDIYTLEDWNDAIYGDYKLTDWLGCSSGWYAYQSFLAVMEQADPDINFNNYDIIVVHFYHGGSCNNPYAAIGGMTLDGEYRDAPYMHSWSSKGTVLHEIGHTLDPDAGDSDRMNHADAKNCAGTISRYCTVEEYGGRYSVMGDRHYDTGHFTAPEKDFLEWLDGEGMVETVTTDGTYELYAIEDDTDTPVALDLSNLGLMLELRTDTGFDDGIVWSEGDGEVLIVETTISGTEGYANGYALLDATPTTGNHYAGILEGAEACVRDPNSGELEQEGNDDVRIEVTDITENEATLDIDFNTACEITNAGAAELAFGGPNASLAGSLCDDYDPDDDDGFHLSLLYCLEPDTTGGPYFTDLSGDAPYLDIIYTLCNNGVYEDCSPSENYLYPGEIITRAEAADLAFDAAKLSVKISSGAPHFADVDTNHEYYEEIETLYAYGVNLVYYPSTGDFDPDDPLSENFGHVFFNGLAKTDVDDDDYSTGSERYLGTDPDDDCGVDAWPTDFDDNYTINILDVNMTLPPFFGETCDDEPEDSFPRHDLIPNCVMNILDYNMTMPPYFGQTCTP